MRTFRVALVLGVLSLGNSFAAGAEVYAALNQPSASDTIEAANLNGSGYNSAFINLGVGFAPQGIVVTPDNSTLFWSDNSNNSSAGIYSRAVSGGAITQIVPLPNASTATGMAVDFAAGKVYWTNSTAKTISRANFNGSSVEVLVNTATTPVAAASSLPFGLTLDVPANKMFWTDQNTDYIYSANLNGTSAAQVFNTRSLNGDANTAPRGIATLAGKLYWVDSTTDKLYSVNQNGTGASTVLDLLSIPSQAGGSAANGLTIANNKLLWTDSSSTEGVYSANLNGTGAGLLFATTASGIPTGITAVPDPSSLHLLTLASGLGGVLVWWKRR